MDSFQVNWLGVIVAAVLNVGIGFAWYSKWLFGPAWMRLCDIKPAKKSNGLAALYSFITALVIGYFLAFFQWHLNIANVSDGMVVGALLWLGFSATTEIPSVIWCKKPFKLFAISTSCKLLSFLVMSGVIAA